MREIQFTRKSRLMNSFFTALQSLCSLKSLFISSYTIIGLRMKATFLFLKILFLNYYLIVYRS